MTLQSQGKTKTTDEMIKNCDFVRKDAQKRAPDVASRTSREAWVTDEMLEHAAKVSALVRFCILQSGHKDALNSSNNSCL